MGCGVGLRFAVGAAWGPARGGAAPCGRLGLLVVVAGMTSVGVGRFVRAPPVSDPCPCAAAAAHIEGCERSGSGAASLRRASREPLVLSWPRRARCWACSAAPARARGLPVLIVAVTGAPLVCSATPRPRRWTGCVRPWPRSGPRPPQVPPCPPLRRRPPARPWTPTGSYSAPSSWMRCGATGPRRRASGRCSTASPRCGGPAPFAGCEGCGTVPLGSRDSPGCWCSSGV